ncbi:reverse transcriptase domain-containing protein [Nephila pilipes]|uniref:Reverse transcriptase domain-containing protein n=1 Tax=Nephila pilipes TaxID=299642 RepID=A0A8X6IGI8_NEPPI|nr:reverse transcriptase domain-containing protein [Nephila pilipes]
MNILLAIIIPSTVKVKLPFLNHIQPLGIIRTAAVIKIQQRALLDVHSISHAFRLLASDDHLTSDVAFAGLQSAVRKKILRDPTPSECAEFLNGNKAGDFAQDSGDLSTQWSRARQAADRLSKFVKFSWTYNEELGCFHFNIFRSPNPVCVVPSTAGLVARLLRDDLESYYIKQLSDLVDQGKTVEVFSQHPASNHFLQAGDFTRFCDWNFIHRARLGCLQLNATMRFSKRNPKCQDFGFAVSFNVPSRRGTFLVSTRTSTIRFYLCGLFKIQISA